MKALVESLGAGDAVDERTERPGYVTAGRVESSRRESLRLHTQISGDNLSNSDRKSGNRSLGEEKEQCCLFHLKQKQEVKAETEVKQMHVPKLFCKYGI